MKKTCYVSGCDRPHYAKGFCKRDYNRVRRGKDPTVDPYDPQLRYELHVDRSDGPNACHPWTGMTDEHGYGRFWHEGRGVLAHRWGYQMRTGETLTRDQHVRHTCDNPPCQNPRHWLIGTHAENVADMVERQRHRRGVRHYAAKLTEQDVRDIRAAWAARVGRGLGRQLAAKYGVTPMVISNLVNGKTWRSVV